MCRRQRLTAKLLWRAKKVLPLRLLLAARRLLIFYLLMWRHPSKRANEALTINAPPNGCWVKNANHLQVLGLSACIAY